MVADSYELIDPAKDEVTQSVSRLDSCWVGVDSTVGVTADDVGAPPDVSASCHVC